MRLNAIIWSGILGLLLSLVSCQKMDPQVLPAPVTPQEPQVPIAQRFRIKKISMMYSNGDSIYYRYSYDTNNRLATYASYRTDNKLPAFEFSKTSMSYDIQENLLMAETVLKYDSATMSSPNYPILTYQYTTMYEYDTDGNIVAIKKYNTRNGNLGYKTLDEEYTFVYDKTKFPKKVTTKLNTGWQFDPTYYFSDEYTSADTNVVSIKHTELPTRLNKYTTSVYTTKLQYDDKLNPFCGLISLGFDQHYAFDIRSICKNNVIKDDEIYSYDANNLLIESAQKNGAREVRYEYEPY